MECHSWRYSLEKAVGGKDSVLESSCPQVSSEAVTHCLGVGGCILGEATFSKQEIGGQGRK